MCDDQNEVILMSKECEIENKFSGKLVGKSLRSDNNMYVSHDTRCNCFMTKIEDYWLWHSSLGDFNFDNRMKISKSGEVIGLLIFSKSESTISKSCQFGKQTRVHFKLKEFIASKPLEIVHTDVDGPTRNQSPRGEKYFILFVDDFNRATWIMLMKEKIEAFINLNILGHLLIIKLIWR